MTQSLLERARARYGGNPRLSDAYVLDRYAEYLDDLAVEYGEDGEWSEARAYRAKAEQCRELRDALTTEDE